MKLSWSHRLFLKINHHVGKSRARDFFFVLISQWLIFIIGFVVLFWGGVYLPASQFKLFVFFEIFALIICKMLNLFIGVLWVHERPVKELPEVRQLFEPYDMWKSFPSDHATVSFAVVFIGVFFGLSWFLVIGLILLAALLSFARVYTGVHYPRDIVMGFLLAVFYAICSYAFLHYFYGAIYAFMFSLFR